MHDGQPNVPVNSIQQDAALEQLLLGDLLNILDDFQEPHSHKWLLTTLDALLQTLSKEFCSDASDGYLQEVLDEFPSWDRQVQILQIQHAELYFRLRELRHDVLHSKARLTAQCRWELYEWIRQVNEHKGREAALLQTALNLEVGVGD